MNLDSLTSEPDVLDAAIIAAAQRVEHYLLQESLEEEAQADRLLSRLAERTINFQAMV
jgi:ferritin-like metal-binding protein YciE